MDFKTIFESHLKPEIGRTYNLLCNLVEKSGVFSKTMLNLLGLLKTALPPRLTDEDRKALQDGLHGIADSAVSKIRKERKRMGNDSRISLTTATFWCMVTLLILLSTFFTIIIFANTKLFHSGILTELIIIHSILITLAFIIIVLTFYRNK